LNRQARGEEQSGSATVKPLEIPRVKNDSGRVTIAPLDENPFVADEHAEALLRIGSNNCGVRLPEIVEKGQAEARIHILVDPAAVRGIRSF
jgi:hypothetical protein